MSGRNKVAEHTDAATIRRPTLKAFSLLLVIAATPVWSLDTATQQVPVEIAGQNGSFSGTLTISIDGSWKKARTEWNATIRNTSPRKTYRVTFCVQAFDASDQQIKPGEAECVLTLWGRNWEPGASLTFKGKQDVKFRDDPNPIQIVRYTISATEVFDSPPNLRTIDARCPIVWSAALRAFADRKFHPTVLDKDRFTATYAYDGGRVDAGSGNLLRLYTTAYTGWKVVWESFRVDNASLYLREEKPGACAAEIKMNFAGFGKPLGGNGGWYAVESNFTLEKTLLDEVSAESRRLAGENADSVAGRISPEVSPRTEAVFKPQLTVTSEPGGAEIEIDGEFIGNTPTTVSVKEGKVSVKVSKSGFQPWQRTLTMNAGDKRTLNAELVKN